MDETELEDGEACAYQDDGDTSTDPDVALSYIDEKIQNVLGHFKKDFEGVVSFENLGAKYGIYGSFLPTYRRSPVCSHSKSPPRVQNHIASWSPNSMWMEGGQPNSLPQAKAPDSVGDGPASSLAHKPPSQNELCRQTTKAISMQSLEDSRPKSEVCDRKTLKVRIKVGSDKLSAKKSAAIYSGLGLDGSQSSSFDDSPVESRGLSHGMPLESYESPAQILQIMTSFPVYGSYFLSPLPYDLIQLSERPNVLQGILTQTSLNANRENSAMGQPKSNKTASGDSVMKLLDRKNLSLQVKRDGKDSRSGFDFSLSAPDIDAVSCDKLIADALKLPLLSNADSTIGESPKASLKEKFCSETALEPSPIDGSLSGKQNGKANSVGNATQTRDANAPNEMISDSGKNGNNKGEAANSSTDIDILGSKSKKASKSDLKEPLKQKGRKSISCEAGKGRLSSGDKKKQKKSRGHGFATENEAMQNAEGCALELKERNCTYTGNYACRSELKNSSMQKELNKDGDKYKDFFGDLNEQEADLTDSPDMPSEDRLMTSQVVDKPTLVHENTSRERTSSSEICKGSEAGVDLKGQLLPESPNSTHVPVERLHRIAAAADISDAFLPKDGKMDKLRKASKTSFQESLKQFLSSVKKKQQLAIDRSAPDAEESPLINELEFYQLMNSDDTFVENQHNKIDKHKADCDPTGGPAKMSMIKSKREPDQGCHRVSKKRKTRSMETGNNVGGTAQDEDKEILGFSSHHSSAPNAAGKDQRTNSEFVSSQISKHNLEGDSPNINENSACPSVVPLHDSQSGGSNVASKKRNTDHFQDPPNSTPSSGELASDIEHFNKKKHRVSKSEGKVHSARNGKADKRDKNMLRHSLDNTESLRKDSLCAQSVLAATSSSSKVSGSLKAKSYTQELKGSPVESVSSSPLRDSNSGKLTSGSKSIVEKGDVHNVVKLAMGSPRKYSDDDYESGSAQSGQGRKDVMDADIHHVSVKPSSIDLQEKSNRSIQCGLAKVSASNMHYNGCDGNLGPDNRDPLEAPTSDRCGNEATRGESLPNTNVSWSAKSCKDSSSLGEDKEMLKNNADKGEVNMSEFYDDPQDQKPVYKGKERGGKFKDQEKCGPNVDKIEKDIICQNQEPSILKSKAHPDYDETKSSMKFDVEKKPKHLVSTAKREKPHCLPPSHEEKNETSNCPPLYRGKGMSTLPTDTSTSGLSKEPKPNKKADIQNGIHHTMFKHSISNGHRIKGQDAPSPLRKDSSTEAARNAIKEARNLKHLADRLKKNAGSSESTGFYFEAALKFLHGASLLESVKAENARHADMTESMEIYSSTARLCEFCAREYEKSKDMATAALAYKCMEVAYMRVVCILHQSASRDRHELQTVLHIVPPGESPSSSASDIDSLNNTATGSKAPQARSSDSPQLAADLVITPRNHPIFDRLLSFAQNVNLAMEASRKSRIAFTAANVGMDQLDSNQGIASIKRALDFNFHDVDGLLRLVRLAKDLSSH